uniref:Bloodthirsty-related gene family, member 12 n=1 Tax=Lepisosteus oculatus TaxID=7918 RepID=W5M312_LEPOC|nr:PREDICTED: E3 ubiquitin-protein ligase TRIM39-like [Lepisosteus oculatus]
MQSVASPRGTLSEEQFQCSICLDIFVDPVSTPCGHSFCMACIRGYWNHSKACQCPMCKKTFPVRPELSVNRVLAEIAEQFQKGGQGGPDGSYAGPGEVSCDSCIGKKLKAAKSCLTCQASYCETHLRHHRKVKTLSKHRLVSPVYRLEEKLCKRHEKLLEGYCRTDQACVCALCVESGHKKHNVVPVEREWRKKLPQLGKKKAEVQQLIKERVKKMEDLKQVLKIIKSSAQKEMEESWQVYSELMQAFERSQAEVVEAIEKKHKAAERQTEGLMRKLEQELSQLKRRNTELDQLLQTEDQVHFLQKFPTLGVLPEHTDWSDTTVQTDLYTGTVRKSVTQLVDRCQEILKRLHGKELKRIQNYAVDVTLDPDTAQCNLVLSEDGKQVRCEGKKQPLPDNPERFHKALFVLGREGFISGRHYWEVEVGRKTAWTLGVAKESVNRKGDIKMSPESGYWCMWLKNGDGYKALSSTRVPLCLLSKPHRVGVYVDYEEGQVSFFDVTAEAHLFTFTDAFTEKLFPLFSPCINQDGRNAAPLAIPALH